MGEARINLGLVSTSQVEEVPNKWIASRSRRIRQLARISLKSSLASVEEQDYAAPYYEEY
jgi:hypothetical protein